MQDKLSCEQRAKRSPCPINLALTLIGDRWTLLIIRDLMFRQKVSYGDLLNSDEGISTNILAARLKQLQAYGFVQRLQDAHNAKRNLYVLTEESESLVPLMLEVIRWGDDYGQQQAAPRMLIESINKHFSVTVDNVKNALRRHRRQVLSQSTQTLSDNHQSGQNP